MKYVQSIYPQTFGKRLRLVRLQHALTQEQLAARSGVARNAIADYETDRYEPKLTNLRQLSQALHVTLDFLAGETDDIEVTEGKSV